MIRKILTAIIAVPIAVVLIGLAVANRQVATISFDPFNAANPAYELKAPVFALVFVVLIGGVIIGGVAAWMNQRKWRRSTRRLESELRRAQEQVEALRRRAGEADENAMPMRWPPARALRPPAA